MNMAVEMTIRKSRRESVLKLLQDGKWHTTAEISSVEVGGSEGTRRLRELRKKYRIAMRKAAQGTQFEYQLQIFGVDVPVPEKPVPCAP